MCRRINLKESSVCKCDFEATSNTKHCYLVSSSNGIFHIGCSGWSYSAWLGHFYPQALESSNWLRYYCSIFDYVEIDSSFYRIPNVFITKRGAKITPDNFGFTAKIPKTVTHDKRLGNGGIDSDTSYFYKSFEPLKGKTLALLLQLPPSMTMKEGLKKIETFPFEKSYRYAVEVRHKRVGSTNLYMTCFQN
jgi:uncharacterized protein YecE (DUF72 family)